MNFRVAFIFVSIFEILTTPKAQKISVELSHMSIPKYEHASKELHL